MKELALVTGNMNRCSDNKTAPFAAQNPPSRLDRQNRFLIRNDEAGATRAAPASHCQIVVNR
jgi:hypothetical protein